MKQEVCNLFLNLVTTVLRRSGWLLVEVIPDYFSAYMLYRMAFS